MIRQVPFNPFASRFVRPDAATFIDDGDMSAQKVWNDLAANGFRGQIIGPHGSGKSTLLATLAAQAQARGLRWVQVTCASFTAANRRRVDRVLRDTRTEDLLVVDGVEQLGHLSAWLLACRRRRLVVTTHRRLWAGLPVVARLRPSPQTAVRVVERLVGPGSAIVDRPTTLSAYNRHRGNIRDMLHELYDRCERQRTVDS